MRVQLLMGFLTLISAGVARAQPTAQIRICLIRTAVEGGSNAPAAVDAVQASFTALLTGPSLSSQSLHAPLVSQAREEAKQAGCPFILLTSLKVVTKRAGGGFLGQIAAGVARQGAVEAGVANGGVAGRIVGSAATGAIQQATQDFAGTIRTRDELTLGYRLETADGTVLVEKKEKRGAKSDGEDLLTPLVQSASERIVESAKKVAPAKNPD